MLPSYLLQHVVSTHHCSSGNQWWIQEFRNRGARFQCGRILATDCFDAPSYIPIVFEVRAESKKCCKQCMLTLMEEYVGVMQSKFARKPPPPQKKIKREGAGPGSAFMNPF